VPVVKGLKAACAAFLNHTGGVAKRGAEEPANTTNTTLEKAKPRRKPRLIRNMAKCKSKEDSELIADPSKIKRDTVVGGLNCYVLHGRGLGNLKGNDLCPDDLSKGSFWGIWPDGRAFCNPPSAWANHRGAVSSIHSDHHACCSSGSAEKACGERSEHKIMGRMCREQWINATAKTSLSQKNQMRMMSNTAAAIMLKRIAPCEKFDDGSEKCHHVYKSGVCIDCKSKKNNCKWAAKKGYPARTKWIDTEYHIGGSYTKKTWGNGYWPANGQSSGDGAESCVAHRRCGFGAVTKKYVIGTKAPPHRWTPVTPMTPAIFRGQSTITLRNTASLTLSRMANCDPSSPVGRQS